MIHDCYDCKHMKQLDDDRGQTFYFCMFSQSPGYCEETGICGNCELDGYAEVIYQRSLDEVGQIEVTK